MIIRKMVYSSLLTVVLLMTGCTSNDEASDILDRSIDGNNNEFDQFDAPGNQDDELSSQLGYVHYTGDEFEEDIESDHFITIDRNRMADTITRLVLRNDEFEDVATLVTDEEVLIAYEKPEDMDRELAATIVKKTGLSILPRFFDVYVSDQPVSFRDIQSLKNSTTLEDDYENTLESIIKEMENTPQGVDLDDDMDDDMQ
ncbi:YhcN/YlaJ family sporulation lipoprotein [Aquibacillus rhizosphaerae]|uniref:YhcN/YlaJ family sporulation lipoprotein n=1 Tax=Aquibacillus rhizosphaerae TaxID=3051431 RepID=A0ABT7L271_9BACI|nr:YhcN/YlaJ family sporulation lipoprotein [Aquibacillus sp. LR5S19]MDL4839949.1 YhcN/YlaJ family sporulation lipoprotein [Aquibacillus sp. LR5S19]